MLPNCRKICILSTTGQKKNNMEFNASKLELLRYGNNSELKRSTHYTSNVGTVIKEKSQTKDLGVIMSTTANFASHRVCGTHGERSLSMDPQLIQKQNKNCHVAAMEINGHPPP